MNLGRPPSGAVSRPAAQPRAGIIVVLRLAMADADVRRLERHGKSSLERMERHRAALMKLRAQIGWDSPPVLLGHYEVALARRQPAVVGLQDGHCGGCRQRLPAGLLAAIRDGQGMTPCPRCRRLLCDAAWLERDFKPATLRAVTRDGP
jgi:predicted  nucleic acid-binding Zn-ribbon protein